jgi:hypothetical protein
VRGEPPNKGMKLSKPGDVGGSWPRQAGVVESGFAAYAQCSADAAPTTEVEPSHRAHGSKSDDLTHWRLLSCSRQLQLTQPVRSADPHPMKSWPLACRIAGTDPSLVSLQPDTEPGSRKRPYPQHTRAAAEQSDEPVEALRLKMPYHDPGVINVRFAGYRSCWADP